MMDEGVFAQVWRAIADVEREHRLGQPWHDDQWRAALQDYFELPSSEQCSMSAIHVPWLMTQAALSTIGAMARDLDKTA